MKLDPIISMAIAVQARKSVYAVLLGSGVSRSSGVLMAWDVVTELINRIADVVKEPRPADPIAWFKQKYQREPTYSSLLAELGPTPADRSNLLRGYFEPTPEEREDGLKVPTLAHRAIARLVAAGHIKVVLTTNFDRLMENALAEVGVTHSVVRSPATLQGLTPLQHSDCTVIKLNGDYTDLETKNTIEELAIYGPELDALLDRVLSEYGLIICGWSGDWDTALRDAILRSTRHRFGTYWLRRGKLSDRAQQVVDFRRAVDVEIRSADEAFVDLETKILALEDSRMAHPLSRAVALATAKRLIADARYRIRFEELVIDEAERLRAELDSPGFALDAPREVTEATVRARAERADSVSANLAAVVAVACYWGDESHRPIVGRALRRVASFGQMGSYFDAWKALRYMPAAFVLYSAGVAALAAEKFATVRFLLTGCTRREIDAEVPLIQGVTSRQAFNHGAGKFLFPPDGRLTPGSDWLYERLKPVLARFVGGEEQYTALFHRFEFLLSMCFREFAEAGKTTSRRDWIPDGRFRWAYRTSVFKEELESLGKAWPPLEVGMFGGDPGNALRLVQAVNEGMAKYESL